MGLDPSIILNAGRGVVPLDNPIDVQTKGLQLRNMLSDQQLQQFKFDQAKQAAQQEQQLNDLYRNAIGPDGTVNRGTVISGAASSGLGSRIPGIQKQWADADKATADVGHVKAQTGEIDFKVAKQRLDAASGAISSLLARPSVTNNDVISVISGLVQNNIMPQEQGAVLVRSMPPDNNPAALRQFLIQHGMQAMEASKRMEMLTPKLEKVDTGGNVQFTDTNPLTRGNAPTTFKKTMTPGEVATDARERDLANTGVTYQQDSNGNIVTLPNKAKPGTVPKATAVLAPGSGLQPLQGKNQLPEAAQKQVVGAQNLQSAVDNYMDKLKGWSNMGMLSPDQRSLMGNAYNNMMLQAKEAYNLGVLNGNDYEILQKVVRDPTNLTSVPYSNEALGNQATELKRIAQGIEDTVYRVHGKQNNTRPAPTPLSVPAPKPANTPGVPPAVNFGLPDDITAILNKYK